MSSLEQQIAEFDRQKAASFPAEILQTMDETTQALKESALERQGLKSGDRAADFELPDHRGETRKLRDYLANSPVVLSFYRGGWCPYCNMELNALQKALPDIEQAGAVLLAVSPETPDHSLSTREKNELAFDILYDKGNLVANSYGLVFELPEVLRPIYDKLGIDIPGFNGDDSFEIPVPATYIISQEGEILYHFIDADYTKRSEPDEIVRQLRLL
ncbi:peroxiredoxin-like family protein [Thiolapillus sp.]